MNDEKKTPVDVGGEPTASFSDDGSGEGSLVGPYKLLSVIGEGGMGTVYLAQQQHPVRRRVALKIIKPGMDSKQVIARFEAERQALSMMDHPNIARVLDVGTTEKGRPYFVMEWVKGKSITSYCDEKCLSVEKRLALFRAVCQGVQHAHQKGIVHRDIKPSNILVTEYEKQAVPKIIDFGLAKALYQPLTEKTLFTQMGQVVGTLEYMSPEQSSMNHLDIDTRTDIFSLGVVLYELLTGTLPLEKKRLREQAIDQVLKIIRDEEPPKPSTRLSSIDSSAIAAKRQIEPRKLGVLLRGDLDWVVMKAIEKDRERRYESSNGLAMDITRYLDGEPVLAAPPSAIYRMRKLLRRHRVAAGVCLAVAVFLILAIAGTSVGMFQAMKEKAKADEQKKIAQTARSEAEYSQYVSNTPAANTFLDEYSPIVARSFLSKAPAVHRNFEWAMLANRAWPSSQHRQFRTSDISIGDNVADYWRSGVIEPEREFVPWQFSGGLNHAQLAIDGQSAFFNMANGFILRFSIKTGQLIRRYFGSPGLGVRPCQSPDGKRLAIFTFSNRAAVWDVETGDLVNKRSMDLDLSSPWFCKWSPDQKYLVSSHMGGDLQIWDAETLKPLHRCLGNKSDVVDLYFGDENGTFWSAARDGTIKQWSLEESDSPLQTYNVRADSEMEFQAISPQGDLVFVLCRDGSHFLWSIRDEQKTISLSEPRDNISLGEPRVAASFSQDQTCIAVVTGPQEVTIYSTSTGEVLQKQKIEGRFIYSVELSRDGKLLFIASSANFANVWTCRHGASPENHGDHSDIVFQIDLDQHGQNVLAASYDKSVSVRDLYSERVRARYTGHQAEVVAVDDHPDGNRAASLDALGNLHVWNTLDGKPIYEINPESNQFARYIGQAGGALRGNFLNFSAVMSTGLFTPDGSKVVTFQKDCMKVFDARNGDVLTELEGASSHGWPVYSRDSQLVAVLEMNAMKTGIWNMKTGKSVTTLAGNGNRLVMIQFSPTDDRLVTCSMGGEIVVWNGRTGKKLNQLAVDEVGNATSCRFSDDGRLILASYTDSTGRIWDSQTGALITTLVGHTNWIRDIRQNPDGSRLLSWGRDGLGRIWDTNQPLANQLGIIRGTSDLIQARWTPDGRDIVTAWSDGSIKITYGATRKDLQQMVDTDPEELPEVFNRWRQQYMNVPN
jgi:serine/threonine protein kinase/WD40 repeat protein